MKEIEFVYPNIKEIPSPYHIEIPYIQKEYLINGEIKKWDGEFRDVYSPIYIKTGNDYKNHIGAFPLMNKDTALLALEAAVKAYDNGNGMWPKMSVEERISCVKKFTVLMKEQKESIVKFLMWEVGKSLNDSTKEFDRTIEYIFATIESLKELDRVSSKFNISQGVIAQIRRAPLGVVLCMGPYNYPLNETFTTLIPALIMGNCVVLKPPKLGILLFSFLLKAFAESFPKGVINTVYGKGESIITPIMESGKINVLAFIGSSKVANTLKLNHPKLNRLRCVLGLEAKNPAIILKDADIDESVRECLTGSLSFNGQRCTAIKIIFVHEDIVDEFVNKLNIAVEDLRIGMPWDESVNITPLPEPFKTEYLTELIDDAILHGANLTNPNGGKKYKSLFFPAILSGVNNRMKIYYEEQFGQIIPIVKYKNINKPLDYVVESNYGQQASVFGKDSDKIAKIIDILVNQVCRVNINCQCQRGPDEFPFTGRKDSAEATLSVSDALRVFSIRTLVSTKETDFNKNIIRDIISEKKSNFLNTDFIL